MLANSMLSAPARTLFTGSAPQDLQGGVTSFGMYAGTMANFGDVYFYSINYTLNGNSVETSTAVFTTEKDCLTMLTTQLATFIQ